MNDPEQWQVSASAQVSAPAAEVFDWLARPANHVHLDGSGNVRGPLRRGQRLRGIGEAFTMRMQWYVPYLVRSRVSEFEEGRLLAWNHFAKHRWRWEVTDLGDGRSQVTETFDASRAPGREKYVHLGFPTSYERVLAASVSKVADHFEASA